MTRRRTEASNKRGSESSTGRVGLAQRDSTRYEVPQEMTNQKKELDLYFEYRCRKGMEWRGLAGKEEYEKRLEHELDVICSMDFTGYFLIVCDLLDWCRENDIPTGTGRGSAGGSLATFCLNITQLDPIRYGLIFERFLDYTRTDSYPDIDLDFGELERHLVFDHIIEKFGADCVCGIGTYGKMKTKGAIRAMCRTLGYPYDMGDELAKLVLPPIAGKEQKLEVCYEKVPELAAAKKGDSGPERKAILEAAEWMEDRLQTFGTHASGLVISDFPVSECIPLGRGKDNSPVAQVDMNDLEEVGLIKFDILGLRALSTIKKCLDIIEERHGEKLNPLDFPVDDPETYDLMCSGDVLGVFQLTCSQGFQSLTTQIQPRNIDDGSMLVAIYRPGPMSMGLHQQIIDVRNGVSEPEYFLPELEPILKDTAGLVVFQEQLMAIGKDLAGYDAAATNKLRKATAKKKKKLMDEQREKFVNGMVANGFQQNKAEELFQSLVDFSSYSFNRCLIGDTQILSNNNQVLTIKEIKQRLENGETTMLRSFNGDKTVSNECQEVIDCGAQQVFRLKMSDDSEVVATLDHKFLCEEDGQYHTLYDIIDMDLTIKKTQGITNGKSQTGTKQENDTQG